MFRSKLTLFRALKALLFYQLQPKMGRFDSVLHFQKKRAFKMASAICRRSHLEHATNYALSELYYIRMLTLDTHSGNETSGTSLLQSINARYPTD